METIQSPSKVSPSGNDDPASLADAVRRLTDMEDEVARRDWIEHCLQYIAIDELLPSFKEESVHYLNSDPHIAQRFAEALVMAADLVGRVEFRALGLIAMGDVYGVLGRYEDSIAAVDEAAALYRSLGDEVGWARTRKEWFRSCHSLGRGEAALQEANRAREILEKHHVWRRAATIEYCIAYACADLGRYTEALARYDHAQAMLDLLDESAELAVAILKYNKANVLTALGDFHTALRLYDEVRLVYIRHGQTVHMLRQQHCVAEVHAAQGHYTRALHAYEIVLSDYRRAGLNYEIANCANSMIECYLNLNRDSEALELAKETVEHADSHGIWIEAANARFYCALAHARLGDSERALDLLNEAERAFAAAGLSTRSILVTLQRAMFHLDDEEWALALREAERASMQLAERGLTIRQAQADLGRARASFHLGEYETARHLAQSALVTSRDREVPWLAHEAHHILGNVARVQGDLVVALEAYDDAVASIEQLQSSLATELRTHFLDDKIRIYDDAIALSLQLSQPERAFAYLERAKSRALVDYLASNLEVQVRARNDVDPELLATLARLREEHNWFYNRLYGYGLTEREGAGPTLSDEALRAAIRDREKEISRLHERLTLDHIEGLPVITPAIAGAWMQLPHLDPGTVLLEYYLCDDGGALFVVLPTGLTVVPLAARPTEILRLLQQWHLNLSATTHAVGSNAPLDNLGRSARGLLAAFYRALIAPVEKYLVGSERLIVIPYGPTHGVPFHALYDGERYLLERIEVSVCPSSNLLRLCSEHPQHTQRSALVIAYSDGGRIPAVCEEARAVAALLPGECYVEEEATRAALVSSVSRHGVLHIASHGEARLDNPTFAHLKLADGQLNMVDIFNLRLQGTLVTLSACETGRSVVAGGDELIGLSRGFLYAGAATLVQSLWRVEDGSTARLMEHFYAGIFAGKPKGTALREAQRAMLATNGAHPYYWAPFQLVGDRGPL